MFHYDSYWKCWSRRLWGVWDTRAPNFSRGPYIDVNLTPIPGSQDWASIRPIIIRAHVTVNNQNDRDVPELPGEIRALMVEELGEELTDRLLTEDFLSQIDWTLHRRESVRDYGGGLALHRIKKAHVDRRIKHRDERSIG